MIQLERNKVKELEQTLKKMDFELKTLYQRNTEISKEKLASENRFSDAEASFRKDNCKLTDSNRELTYEMQNLNYKLNDQLSINKRLSNQIDIMKQENLDFRTKLDDIILKETDNVNLINNYEKRVSLITRDLEETNHELYSTKQKELESQKEIQSLNTEILDFK